jgi:hypothetical protein
MHAALQRIWGRRSEANCRREGRRHAPNC